MDDSKALMERAPEIVAALERACCGCDPTPCCEYEVLGSAAAALIKAQAAQLAEKDELISRFITRHAEEGMDRLRLKRQLAEMTADRDDLQAQWDMYGGADGIQAMAVKAAERDGAGADIHRCCDTCEWYRPSWKYRLTRPAQEGSGT